MTLICSCCDVCEMSILPLSYKLALCWYSPIWQRRTSPAKSDPSSTENTFSIPFKQRKLPAAHQCSEGKRQDICVFAKMIGEFDVGKRHGRLSWSKTHWRYSLYTEVNVGSNPVPCHLLFSGAFAMAVLPCLYKLALCSFLCLCKHSMVMPNLPSPEKKIGLKCLSDNGKYLHQTRAPRLRGTKLSSVP